MVAEESVSPGAEGGGADAGADGRAAVCAECVCGAGGEPEGAGVCVSDGLWGGAEGVPGKSADECGAVGAVSAGEARSVTDVALECGFSHLGRFSTRYRALFGESPSETGRSRK